MSVLVPTIPDHSYLINQYFNGKKTMIVNNEHDQVPFGVVNSMKRQLLDKFTKHDSRNQQKQRQPKINKQISRSQDNLLSNSHLQAKENVIIIDRTPVHEQKSTTYRHSYTENIVDEVPKPGTVSTVKSMFERQIRLSRSEQTMNTHSTRDNRHSTRTRSVSPNDMALRQRRTVAVPTMTSIPDVIISHRPTNENLISSDKQKESFDFHSRLALFNRTNTNEQLKTPTSVSLSNIDDTPDVIGANVKLNKSSLSSGQKRIQTRVQFIDDVRTFEYPSFRLLMSEYSNCSDNESESDNHADEHDSMSIDDDFEQIYAEYKTNEQLLQSKGSFQTFRPTYLDQYELGSQHSIQTSDSKITENESNQIHWTTDLLF